MFVPKDAEGIKERFGTSEQEFTKLRLALRVEAHDFPIEDAPATPQVTSKCLTKVGERFDIPVPRDQSNARFHRNAAMRGSRPI
jgi:hypothetical protein